MPPSACSKRPSRSVLRTGESAFDVAEQLVFQNGRREPGAVQRDQPVLAALAVVVDRAGDQFFARAAFAQDQDGNIAVGDLPGGLHDLLHRAGSCR